MTSHTDPHGPTGSIRERLSRDWNRLQTAVRSRFSKLSDEDVHAIHGQYDELCARLARAYGYDRSRCDAEISRFVSEGIRAARPARIEEEQPGDPQAMGAVVGGDDEPIVLVPERPSHPEAGAHRERMKT